MAFHFGKGEHQVFEFDGEDAEGVIAIERGPCGLLLYVEPYEEPVACVDLFWSAQPSEDDALRRDPQIIVWAPGGHPGSDPVGYVHLLDGHAVWEEES